VRIAQLVSSYHPRVGGVETHVGELSQGLAEAGDQVTVLTHEVAGSAAADWVGPVEVLRFPLTVKSHNYPLSLRLFRYLRSHRSSFDLAHVHSYHTLVGHAAVGAGLPLVFTPHYHGTGHTPFRAQLHRLYRPAGARLFRAADAIICVSASERGQVLADFPAVAGKVVTIPNGTHRPAASPSGASETDLPVVLTVGRLERYKNIDLIIDAVQALPSPASLVVVGDGPDRPRLERHNRVSAGRWPVTFTGRISDTQLGGLLAQASVVTSASDHEAFGLTLTEGLAAGARVVASAIPAHAEIAQLAGAEAPVILVDPRDTGQFSASLAASVHAGRVAAGFFGLPSWAEVVAATRELYARVAA
jgi:glycosyltransferase involved in cell wall biosynthesis